MGLWYQNSYTDPVYVAILWYDAGCGGQPWRKSGWYEVASGSSAAVFTTSSGMSPSSSWT